MAFILVTLVLLFLGLNRHGYAQNPSSASVSPKRRLRCPKTTTFVFGSFNKSPFHSDFTGAGLTFAVQDGRQLTTLNILSHGITGDNPTYVARPPHAGPGDVTDLFVCNSLPTGSITRIMSSRNPPFVVNDTFVMPNQQTAHVSVTSRNIVLSANVFGGTVYAFTYPPGPVHAMSGDRRHGCQHRYKKDGLRLTDVYTIDVTLATNLTRRQTAPQPHMVLPYCRGVIVPDLGTDFVFYLSISPRGKLSEIQRVKLEPGDGPRHAVAHGPTRTLYVVNELSQTVNTLCADGPLSAPLRVCQRFELLNSGAVENGTAAAIRVSRDSRFLYVSVRRDTRLTPITGRIVAFSLAPNGLIKRKIGEWSSGGAHPRDFNIIESIRVDGECRSYIAVANRDSDNVIFFRRNKYNGLLGGPELMYNVSTPSSVLPL